MKGEKRLKLLAAIQNGAEVIEDLFLIFTAPYGSSVAGIEYHISRYHEKKNKEKSRVDQESDNRQRFSEFLYKIKRDGLIEVKKKGKTDVVMVLTKKGKEVLRKLMMRKAHALPESSYGAVQDVTLKIVMFDIPEKESRKRRWLRNALLNLGFAMLQKSLWAGKKKIPEEFIDDLKKLNLLNYIEILAVTKTGSLKEIL